MVKRPTKRPDAKLERVRVFGSAIVFLPGSAFSADSYGVRVAPVGIRIRQIRAHVNIPSTSSHIPLFRHSRILHTLIGMSSAALAAAVLYPVTVIDPKFPRGKMK